MKKFDEIMPLLTEEDKETLMEIGFNFLQAQKLQGDETHE